MESVKSSDDEQLLSLTSRLNVNTTRYVFQERRGPLGNKDRLALLGHKVQMETKESQASPVRKEHLEPQVRPPPACLSIHLSPSLRLSHHLLKLHNEVTFLQSSSTCGFVLLMSPCLRCSWSSW